MIGMSNPWEKIGLDDYERHMSLDTVWQLQALDGIMKEQFNAYPAKTAMIFGIAGGNGLGNVCAWDFEKIYGVDINREYLKAVEKRYPQLSGMLECIRADIVTEAEKLPTADMLIADLVVEYIGYEAFVRAVSKVSPRYVSCVIQVNGDEREWVSDSPYIHVFDILEEVHHSIDEKGLAAALGKAGYKEVLHDRVALPNGKTLVRADYVKE